MLLLKVMQMGRGLLVRITTVTLLSLAVSPIATSVASGITSDNNKIASTTSLSISLDSTATIPSSTKSTTTNITVAGDNANALRYGYNLTIKSANNQTGLINDAVKEGRANREIAALANATPSKPMPLATNTWGYRLNTTDQGKYIGLTNQDVAIKAARAGEVTGNNGTTDTTAITYGANFNSDQLAAGTYKVDVVYTVTANLPPLPTITSLATTHNDDATNTANYTDYNKAANVTMTGTNLLTVNKVWVDLNDDGQQQDNELATNVKPLSETQLTYTTPTDTKPGIHDTYVISDDGTVSTKNTAMTNRYSYIAPSVCRSGDTNSTCAVDIDTNMIPVKHASTDSDGNATWHAITNPKTATDWYDYNNKQWANAVTVKDPTKYSNGNGTYKDLDVADADILGFYVYIPRYEYEVQRRDATDKVVQAQNYNIRFSKASDIKKSPVKSCNSDITTAAQMWRSGTADNAESNILAKDYRTGCGLNRTNYPSITTDSQGVATTLAANNANQTTWTTHPAFTWMTSPTRELNGFWMGKFETTGSTTAPTVRPNEKHIANVARGVYYDIAKSMGTKDDANTGGNGTATTQNNQHLSKYQSHMLIQTEWGAATYLSASPYGTGVNKVQINAVSSGAKDDNNNISYGITGCGPQANDNKGSYSKHGAIKTAKACFADDVNRGYTGTLGQLASTTGNITGIYDMSGGAMDHTMGNLTARDKQTTPNNVDYFKNQTKPPYVNLYRTSDGFGSAKAWSAGADAEWKYNWDICTYETCGGQALHENKLVQSVATHNQSWGSTTSSFTHVKGRWSDRGGDYSSKDDVGVFYMNYDYDRAYGNYAFRAALLPTE